MIVTYIRVSTNKQDTDAQLTAINSWCKKRQYTVSHEYIDEAASGKSLTRPAIQSLLADARDGKIKKIITYELSRLSRDLVAENFWVVGT